MTTSFDGMLPIREVARLTGVNAVTLRAWERRYGLIEPHRTEKGHRLYTQANLEEVRSILTWLSRGVNVGQVKGLIDQAAALPDEASDGLLSELRTDLLDALQRFDLCSFEQHLAVGLDLYGCEQLCAEVFEPTLEHLQQRWQGQFGSQLEEVYFYGWLRAQLARWLRLQAEDPQASPVVLANLSAEHCEPGMWLLATLLSGSGIVPLLLEWEVPASELGLLLDRMPETGVVFYSSQALPAHQLRRHLPRLARLLPGRLFVAGPAAAIHQDEWAELGIIPLGTRPTTAHGSLMPALQGTRDD